MKGSIDYFYYTSFFNDITYLWNIDIALPALVMLILASGEIILQDSKIRKDQL